MCFCDKSHDCGMLGSQKLKKVVKFFTTRRDAFCAPCLISLRSAYPGYAHNSFPPSASDRRYSQWQVEKIGCRRCRPTSRYQSQPTTATGPFLQILLRLDAPPPSRPPALSSTLRRPSSHTQNARAPMAHTTPHHPPHTTQAFTSFKPLSQAELSSR